MYEGLWENDEPHGYGVCEYPNGEVYEGNWRYGLKHGQGSMKMRGTAESYVGYWDFDVRQGVAEQVGIETSPSPPSPSRLFFSPRLASPAQHISSRPVPSPSPAPRRLSHPFRSPSSPTPNPLPCPPLTSPPSAPLPQVYSNGDVFRGHFHFNVRSGSGVLVEASGASYDGMWLDGKQHGKGVYRAVEGWVYSGEWVAGQRSGKGTCEYPNGEKYIGEWKAHVRSGEGRLERRVGQGKEMVVVWSYEGSWRDDLPNGQGKSVSAMPPHASGEVYEGSWLRGKRHGRGKCSYLGGECYVGDWRHGERQGVGSLAHKAKE